MEKKDFIEFTPEVVESLEPGQVFVFGSNPIGFHSGGASLVAFRKFGAVWEQAEGPQGQCYAIPVDVRGENVGNISSYLMRHIDKFLSYAKQHQELFFLVPRIGCGAAGFDDAFMAPFFKEAMNMKNVSLPKSFVEILKQEKTEEKGDGKQRIFNLIILDESGSMQMIREQAVSGLNETFQTIRLAQENHPEQQHYISFLTFNSDRIKKVMDRLAVDTNKELKWNDFWPNSCTPLFDAMGQSLSELKTHVRENDVVLVTIITDGMENSSKEYSGNNIKDMVNDLKKKGWVFAYIGTNQDVDAIADNLGIRSRMQYNYSPEGAASMFRTARNRNTVFYDRIATHGKEFLKDENFDFFDSDNNNEKEEEKRNDTEDSQKETSNSLWARLKNRIKK